MINPQTISVIDKINLPEFAIQEIVKLSNNDVVFPDADSKDENETIERVGNSSIVLGSWNSTITKSILDKRKEANKVKATTLKIRSLKSLL